MNADTVHPHLSEPLCASKNIFVRITQKFRYVKYIEKYITKKSSITI